MNRLLKNVASAAKTRRESARKRSLQTVNEHSEPVSNTVLASAAVLQRSVSYGLLLSVLMVIAPHADHLPLWVSALCGVLLLWRAWLAYSGDPLPKRWLLLMLTFAGTIGIIIEFRTLFGREAGVTLLIMLAALKFMELHKARDAMVLIYLACLDRKSVV